MSLVQTCRLNRVNPFTYILKLVRHSAEVKADPTRWMPWNFQNAETQPTPPQSDPS
jgi:hypothetical protein